MNVLGRRWYIFLVWALTEAEVQRNPLSQSSESNEPRPEQTKDRLPPRKGSELVKQRRPSRPHSAREGTTYSHSASSYELS